MEPGVSAEDCLYADLGIDPGKLRLPALRSEPDDALSAAHRSVRIPGALAGRRRRRSVARRDCDRARSTAKCSLTCWRATTTPDQRRSSTKSQRSRRSSRSIERTTIDAAACTSTSTCTRRVVIPPARALQPDERDPRRGSPRSDRACRGPTESPSELAALEVETERLLLRPLPRERREAVLRALSAIPKRCVSSARRWTARRSRAQRSAAFSKRRGPTPLRALFLIDDPRRSSSNRSACAACKTSTCSGGGPRRA